MKFNYSIIEEELIQFLDKEYNIKISKDNLDLKLSQLSLDSLDAVNVILWGEDTFNITISNKEFSDTETLRNFVELVYQKLNQN